MPSPTWSPSGCSACSCIPTSRTRCSRDSETIGLFLGTAVHDTSQVVGAALTYKQLYGDDVVLRTATVTKLTRNLFLAVVIPCSRGCTCATGERGCARDGRMARSRFGWTKYVPGFVLGFLGMAVLRSVGDAMVASTGAAYGMFDAADG